MILIARRTVLLALIIFSVTVLTAQNDSDVMEKIQRTKAFLLKQRLSPDYRDSVRKAVIAYEKKLDNYCKDVELDFDSVDVRTGF